MEIINGLIKLFYVIVFNFNPENELSFLLNYEIGFMNNTKDLINEIIIKNIIYYYNVNK